jgi:hypothetical protein
MTNNDNKNRETTETVPAAKTLYTTCSGRVVKPPQHCGFEEAFAVINTKQNTTGNAMLFQNALKQCPKEAMKALCKEA